MDKFTFACPYSGNTKRNQMYKKAVIVETMTTFSNKTSKPKH